MVVESSFNPFSDLTQGFKAWRVWLLLGWQDIRLRYRRSVLGPWWITMSMLVTMLALGMLYGNLFKLPLEEFLPYLSVGLLVWALVISQVTEGTNCFVDNSSYIKQISLPYSVFILRALTRNFLIFLHNIIPVLLVLLYFSVPMSLATFAIVFNLLIILFNGFCYSWIFAVIGARFRDVMPIIASLMQIIFFLTPIIWEPRMLPEKYSFIVDYNPVAQFVDLVRKPLMGEMVSMHTYYVVGVVSVVGFVGMLYLLNRTRKRIVYWL